MTDVEPELQFGFVPAKVVADLHDIGNWKVRSPKAGHRLPAPPPCALRVALHVLRRPHPGLAVRWCMRDAAHHPTCCGAVLSGGSERGG